MSEPAAKKPKMPVILGYWKIRGLAQPIRLLLKYTDTEFENVMYTQGDAPGYSREEWTSVKFTLGLDFPNLPYLIDGDLKITQSNAILAYIGRKNNMCGKTESEKVLVDMLAQETMDFRNGFVRVAYNPNMESMRDDYIKNVKTKITTFSKFLGDKPWFAGKEITYVDFPLYELFDQHRMFEPQLLDGFDNIKAFLDRFEAIPAIKAYMASPEFLRYPVNNNTASWVG